MRRQPFSWARLGLSVLFFGALFGVARVQGTVGPPGDARRVLEAEYETMGQPTAAIRSEYRPSAGLDRALVSAYYRGDLSYLEIRRHYDDAAARQGWQFEEESSLPTFAGVTREYCKGEYELALVISDDRQASGWTYALTFHWGGGPHWCGKYG
jgi:hypothetical protein